MALPLTDDHAQAQMSKRQCQLLNQCPLFPFLPSVLTTKNFPFPSPCNRSVSTTHFSYKLIAFPCGFYDQLTVAKGNLQVSCLMAYIPPHKRHSRDIEKQTPTAELLAPSFNRKLNLWPYASHFIRKDLRPSGRKENRSGKVTFGNQAINKWFSIGSSDDGHLFTSCVHLEQFSVLSIERRRGERPLALMNSNLSQGNRTMPLTFHLLVV
ncbi:hypothetical protein E5676_scaffold974G00010 [Cucumis melo var. makuwa]|uniref:DUF7903 domain-containing protein n=1 Tax=Cucumis melo var. makuwa TaxID=1194695 RepID=A0A5D3E4T4_CUCMM|nr:hypothetical protein E6C27_scaffold55G00160 [Cucumis melo var. makuwa]TYK30581.1 hypothetical protein E5676_scaffold974G00010 [Cucumis melo var. makuwa]